MVLLSPPIFKYPRRLGFTAVLKFELHAYNCSVAGPDSFYWEERKEKKIETLLPGKISYKKTGYESVAGEELENDV